MDVNYFCRPAGVIVAHQEAPAHARLCGRESIRAASSQPGNRSCGLVVAAISAAETRTYRVVVAMLLCPSST
jgi:hypothetical protein